MLRASGLASIAPTVGWPVRVLPEVRPAAAVAVMLVMAAGVGGVTSAWVAASG
ncbi:hypothetical protein [Frankia umida]|uniref:hypothetical protein n=1 Tax=Frankia umida TaxID=573489 RepID=UPI00200FC14C|nr:hypothetical protein [Frankia umida]